MSATELHMPARLQSDSKRGHARYKEQEHAQGEEMAHGPVAEAAKDDADQHKQSHEQRGEESEIRLKPAMEPAGYRRLFEEGDIRKNGIEAADKNRHHQESDERPQRGRYHGPCDPQELGCDEQEAHEVESVRNELFIVNGTCAELLQHSDHVATPPGEDATLVAKPEGRNRTSGYPL